MSHRIAITPLVLLSALSVVAALASFVQATDPTSQPAIVLDRLPLLFADDSVLASSSGWTRTFHPGTRHDSPVLEGQLPQEGSRVYLHGTVHYDAVRRRYEMWYAGHPDGPKVSRAPVQGFRLGKGNFVLYATSSDGIRWERLELGLHAYLGSAANNLVFDLHSPSVLVDLGDPDPSRRYKMLGSTGPGYCTAVSADGLSWHRFPDKPVIPSSDNCTLTQHPTTGEYLAYHRPAQPEVRGVRRRAIALSRSADFQTWSEPELVFVPDEEDDRWATQPGERTDVNNISVFPHAGGFLAMATIFRVTAADRPKHTLGVGQSPTDGVLDVQLLTSPDGRRWSRTPDRAPIIPRGPAGAFDAGSIFSVGSTLTHVGDETRVYYTGMTTSHGAPIPPKRIAIGFARWRLHGLASMKADTAGACLQTKPLRLQHPTLTINADASHGRIRVAILEADGTHIPGYELEACLPMTIDATGRKAHWQAGSKVPTDRPVRIVVEATDARLFSLSSEVAASQ